jgi:hypothetical protein
VFRNVQRPVYGRGGLVSPEPGGDGELAELLAGGDTWTVG